MNDVLNYFDHDHATPEEVSTGKYVRGNRHIVEESMDTCREPSPHPASSWSCLFFILCAACLLILGGFFWLMLGPAITAVFG